MKTTIENSTRETAFREMFVVFIFSLNWFPFNERQLKVLHLLVYVLGVMQKDLQYLFCSFFSPFASCWCFSNGLEKFFCKSFATQKPCDQDQTFYYKKHVMCFHAMCFRDKQ